jgi:threonine dehydrogenase-like Zn-dependent dehydrogenase
VSDRAGSITEPLACAIRAVDRSGLRSADRVCVVGGGPLGLLILMVAKASGARTTVVSEPSPYRRALAERLGADLTVDPGSANLKEVLSELTDGYGPEVVFEVVGLRATIEQAIDLAAPGGTVVIAGVPDQGALVQLSPAGVLYRELTIRGTKGITHGMDRALRWLGVMDVEPLLTHTFPLARVAEAVELSLTGGCGKVLIEARL